MRLLPAVPKPIVQKVSSRYIAGPDLADGIRAVRELNASGKLATVDVLGEEIRDAEATHAFVGAYRETLAAIEREALDANISVKLTALGLELDAGLCRENLETVVVDAAERGTFVRIDMEDSSCTDETLHLYRELREAGHDNVGVVLQSRLRRTVDDVRALADLRPSVRLCKGIYVEPEELAFQGFEEVQTNFVRALEALLDCGAYVAIATHDEWLIGESLRRLEGLAPDAYELQMLLGVREQRADFLVAAGHRLRVYVPYGRQWYAYSVRRLQENPAMAGMMAKATLARLVGR